MYYLLKRDKEYLLTDKCNLSTLAGYENKVQGYETWTIIHSWKTEKAQEKYFSRYIK